MRERFLLLPVDGVRLDLRREELLLMERVFFAFTREAFLAFTREGFVALLAVDDDTEDYVPLVDTE